MSLATWIADKLLAIRDRGRAAREEVAEHDAQAAEIQTDLDRYAADHATRTEQSMTGTRNRVAGAGHLYSGTMRSELEGVMAAAQEAFRNEASAKVRAFKKLARSEGDGHREKREGPGPTLRLSDEALAAVEGWRERPYPIPDTGEGPLRPRDLIGADAEIAPLLEPGGLTWADAAREPE